MSRRASRPTGPPTSAERAPARVEVQTPAAAAPAVPVPAAVPGRARTPIGRRTDAVSAIVLIGPPATGKSRLARRLARLLDLPLVDVDARIARRHGAIAQIFAERGEARFRELELTETLTAIAEGGVVSLGGGAPMNDAIAARLAADDVFVIALTASPEAIRGRIDNDRRPLIRSLDDWISIAARRAPRYAELADTTLDTSRAPFEATAREAAARVAERLAAGPQHANEDASSRPPKETP